VRFFAHAASTSFSSRTNPLELLPKSLLPCPAPHVNDGVEVQSHPGPAQGLWQHGPIIHQPPGLYYSETSCLMCSAGKPVLRSALAPGLRRGIILLLVHGQTEPVKRLSVRSRPLLAHEHGCGPVLVGLATDALGSSCGRLPIASAGRGCPGSEACAVGLAVEELEEHQFILVLRDVALE